MQAPAHPHDAAHPTSGETPGSSRDEGGPQSTGVCWLRVERRKARAGASTSAGAAAIWPQSTGICRLRGEPRQCGDRAHRLVAPSLAPTGERRPSRACLRPIPAPPRLSPVGCPWLRRCCPTRFDGNGWCRRSASCTPPKRSTPRSRRTSMQGDFVRAVHGCTAPACWSRTRNHAADEIPLQRRLPPGARLFTRPAAAPPEARPSRDALAAAASGIEPGMARPITAGVPARLRPWPWAAGPAW